MTGNPSRANTSLAGEGWRSFYESGCLSWVDPSEVDRDYIGRLAAGAIVAKLLDLAGHPGPSGTRVLEAGCGAGLYALALASVGYHVDAFDFNERAVEIARQLAAASAIPESLASFQPGNILSITSAADAYDLVFNQAVVEYFVADDEYETALSELIRVLKPGGSLVLVVQNTGHALWPLKRLLGWRGYEGQPPVRRLAAAGLARDLRRLGLTDVRTDGVEPWKGLFWGIPACARGRPLHQPSYLVHRTLAKAVPLPALVRSRLAVQFVVAGRKP